MGKDSGYYSSYSGADIVTAFRMPDYINGDPLVFGKLNAISHSSYRDKFPVRAIGSSLPRGFTKGGKTIAGTLVFDMFGKPVINEFVDALYGKKNIQISPDELPAFDVHINFLNEYGEKAYVGLYDVEIVEGNQMLTIDSLQTDEQYSFVARNISFGNGGVE